MGVMSGITCNHFPPMFDARGIDINKHAIELAQAKYPHLLFGNVGFKTEFRKDMFSVVFTRGVMIHLTVEQVHEAIREMMTVSNKYIFHLEYFGKDGESVPYEVGLWKRNMKEYYKYLPVSIISDCDIPVEIDKDKVHFTLVKIK